MRFSKIIKILDHGCKLASCVVKNICLFGNYLLFKKYFLKYIEVFEKCFPHLLSGLRVPFQGNKNSLKIIQALLYTHFYNIFLNVQRLNFLNICNLPISHFPNIRKIRVKVGPKTNYFSYFMSSCTDRIVVFNNFFHLYLANQEKNKTVPAIFFFSNIFWIMYF